MTSYNLILDRAKDAVKRLERVCLGQVGFVRIGEWDSASESEEVRSAVRSCLRVAEEYLLVRRIASVYHWDSAPLIGALPNSVPVYMVRVSSVESQLTFGVDYLYLLFLLKGMIVELFTRKSGEFPRSVLSSTRFVSVLAHQIPSAEKVRCMLEDLADFDTGYLSSKVIEIRPYLVHMLGYDILVFCLELG